MVLANETVFAAGVPDVVPDNDPYGAFEGRKGARLLAFSVVDGEELAEYDLKHEPVFDGMVAANGRLYMTTQHG